MSHTFGSQRLSSLFPLGRARLECRQQNLSAEVFSHKHSRYSDGIKCNHACDVLVVRSDQLSMGGFAFSFQKTMPSPARSESPQNDSIVAWFAEDILEDEK